MRRANIVMGSIYNKNLYADDILLSAFNPKLSNKVVKNPSKVWCLVHGVRENDLVKARITWYGVLDKVKQNFSALIPESILVQKLEWQTKVPLADLRKVKIRFSIHRKGKILTRKYMILN